MHDFKKGETTAKRASNRWNNDVLVILRSKREGLRKHRSSRSWRARKHGVRGYRKRCRYWHRDEQLRRQIGPSFVRVCRRGNDFNRKVCSPSGTSSGILSCTLFTRCVRFPCKCTVHEALGAITIAAVSARFIVQVSDLWGCSLLAVRVFLDPSLQRAN